MRMMEETKYSRSRYFGRNLHMSARQLDASKAGRPINKIGKRQ